MNNSAKWSLRGNSGYLRQSRDVTWSLLISWLKSLGVGPTPPTGLQLSSRNMKLMVAIEDFTMGIGWIIYHSHKVDNLWLPCGRNLGSIWWCHIMAMSAVTWRQGPRGLKHKFWSSVTPLVITTSSYIDSCLSVFFLNNLANVLIIFSLINLTGGVLCWLKIAFI